MQEAPQHNWQDIFWHEIEKNEQLSLTEKAGFLAILDGFTVAGGNLEANADHVLSLLMAGQFEVWGKQFQIDIDSFLAVNFLDPKWRLLAGQAMKTLHLKGSDQAVHPKSLMFLSDEEKSNIAQGFLQTIQIKVGRRYQNQYAKS